MQGESGMGGQRVPGQTTGVTYNYRRIYVLYQHSFLTVTHPHHIFKAERSKAQRTLDQSVSSVLHCAHNSPYL